MTSTVQNGITSGKRLNVRTYSVLTIVLVGMVAYHFSSSPVFGLHKAESLASVQPALVNIKVEASSVGNADVVVNTASESARFKFKGEGEGSVRHESVQSGEAAANIAVASAIGGSRLLVESIRSSRARAHKLTVRHRAGVTIQQYSARLKYQVVAARQQLHLARNQLNQLQVSMHVTKGQRLSKAGSPSQSIISGLKNRIKQLELSLSAQLRLQQQSQQQLAMISRHPGRSAGAVPSSLAYHMRHQF